MLAQQIGSESRAWRVFACALGTTRRTASAEISSGLPQLKLEWSLPPIFGLAREELSRYFKDITLARIREFESSHPSHTVVRSCSHISVFVRQPVEIAGRIIPTHSRLFVAQPLAAGKIDGIYDGIFGQDTVCTIDAEIPS